MKAITIPKSVLHMHHLTAPATYCGVSSIAITGDGKTATAVATDGYGLITMAWPCEQECDLRVPGSMAKKLLSFCRTDNAEQKDVITVSANKGMVTVTVTRKGVRKDASVPLGMASMSGFFSQRAFPKWRDLWETEQSIVAKQVIGVDAEMMASIFSTLHRLAGKHRGIKCEFTAANRPIRFTVAKQAGDDLEIKALLMPVAMDLA